MSSTEDMLAIQQVIAQYSYTFDFKDAEGWANLFTEDGVWESYRGNNTEPGTSLKSRQEIRQWAESSMERRLEGSYNLHHQTALLFDELTDDSAQTRTMVLITAHDATDEPNRISLTGYYQTRWRKTAQGWLIEHCTLRS